VRIKAFWKRVKILLNEKKATQAMAAKVCARPLNTFRGWMSKDLIPPLDCAYELAQYLGVSLEYLITGRETEMAAQIEEARFLLAKANEKLKRYTVKTLIIHSVPAAGAKP
jgi:hypothetical protein